MASKPKVVPDDPYIIQYKGSYDYDGLLTLIREFFVRARFEHIKEPKFKYKVGGTGAEGEFKINSSREVNDYIQIQLEVKGKFWDVSRDAKGVTTGKIEVIIHSKFIHDYNDYFKANKAIDEWMKSSLDSPTGLMYGDNKLTGKKYLEKLTAKLQKEIKKHLNMECV